MNSRRRRDHASASKAPVLLVAAAILGAVALGTAVGAGPTTTLPPEKQALDDQIALWQAQAQADADPAQKLSDPGGPILANPPEDWPEGVIGNEGAPWSAMDFIESNAWQGWIGGRRVSIYAGSQGTAPDKGVLMFVIEADGNLPLTVTQIAPPWASGRLTIMQADGSTLQLVDPSGRRFTFDGAALKWQTN